MTPATTRRLWFLGLWLMLPWPLPFLDTPFAPAVRYLILATAGSTLALFEGGAGPITLLIVLFAVWGGLTTFFCWALGWAMGRLLGTLAPPLGGRLTWVCLAVALAIALTLEPYATPFGRAARGGLLEVLS